MKEYLTILTRGENNWNALVPQLQGIIAGKDREATLTLARENIALALRDQPQEPTITRLDQVDHEVLQHVPEDAEVLMLSPAPMNPVSLEIQRALKAAHISQAELARRLNLSRATVNRLVDPFNWGHSLPSLQKVADVLGEPFEFHFMVLSSRAQLLNEWMLSNVRNLQAGQVFEILDHGQPTGVFLHHLVHFHMVKPESPFYLLALGVDRDYQKAQVIVSHEALSIRITQSPWTSEGLERYNSPNRVNFLMA